MQHQRIRSIKPEVGKHELLFDLERQTGLPIRFAWVMLWTCCDRDGRFEWRPRRLKTDCLPYDDVDFARILNVLRENGLVTKYKGDGTREARVADASATDDDALTTPFYGCIPTWKKHQFVNHRESASVLPPPTMEGVDEANNQLDLPGLDASVTREARVDDAVPTMPGQARVEREGEREGEREVSSIVKPLVSKRVLGSGSPTAAVSIPLNDNSEFTITAAQIQEWQSIYPAIDVLAELLRIRQWSLDNPKRRKTKRGIASHITGWLCDEQDKGGRRSREARVGTERPAPTPPEPSDPIPDGLNEVRGVKLWGKALGVMEKKINRHTFDTWIKPLRALGMNGTVLYLSVPNPEFRLMFAKHSTVAAEVLAGDGVESIVPLCVNRNG